MTLACAIMTAPMIVDRRYYLVLGVGHETADVPTLSWWHALTTPFVHGGGFPGTIPHLVINGTFFLVLGTLMERALGTGRCFAVTGTSLAVQLPLKYWLIDGRGHGASGMTWSYWLFAVHLLVFAWRRDRRGLLRDPSAYFVALCVLLEIVGLVKHWHLWNTLVSLPFYLWWRRTLGENLERIDAGEAIDAGGRVANAIGTAIPALFVGFSALMVGAAVLGYL